MANDCQILNQRGSITVDYLFSFFLVSGFSLVIMTFSATLSMIEIVQYMSFAAARSYFAGNLSEQKQVESGANKFFELKENPTVQPLLNGGWFHVPNESLIVATNLPAKYPDYADYGAATGNGINLFHGVVVDFQARILDFQVPFFGGTKKRDVAGGTSGESDNVGFITKITAFLGREPSFEECMQFNENRWTAIKKLGSSSAPYSEAKGDNDYIVINDNGC